MLNLKDFLPNPKLTFQNCEKVLDAGRLQTLGRNGKWYDLCRNGKTKLWKTKPYQAEIPVKLGFYETFRIKFDNQAGGCVIELRVKP